MLKHKTKKCAVSPSYLLSKVYLQTQESNSELADAQDKNWAKTTLSETSQLNHFVDCLCYNNYSFFNNSPSSQTESGVTREGKRKIDHNGDTGNGSCDSPDPERKRAKKSCGDTSNQNLHAQTDSPNGHSSALCSTHSGVKRTASEDDEEQRPGSSKRRRVIS